jgi:hypothetical protein
MENVGPTNVLTKNSTTTINNNNIYYVNTERTEEERKAKEYNVLNTLNRQGDLMTSLFNKNKELTEQIFKERGEYQNNINIQTKVNNQLIQRMIGQENNAY